MANQLNKPRWNRADAVVVARELCSRLQPYCERLVVAGSLRRMKPTVGDIEILYIPKFNHQLSLFGSEEGQNLADIAIGNMLGNSILSKRLSASGKPSWGTRNKLAVHHTGIPIDLFQADAASWFNYLVCRTGPAEINVRIASLAQKKGYRWNPYGAGFTRLSDGVVIPMESEEAVFSFVALPYRDPKFRQ